VVGVWFGHENWAMKFFEYRMRWYKSDSGKHSIELVSQKFLIGQSSQEVSEVYQYPLFNDKDEVIGVQLEFTLEEDN
jgi:hypothetical protein